MSVAGKLAFPSPNEGNSNEFYIHMLMMRLQRIGRKNSPSYRVLVVDSRQGVKSGKFIDHLGSYDPKGGIYTIDAEKAKAWIAKGVQPSSTVHNMLVSKGVIDAPKRTVIAPKKEAPVVEAAPVVEEAPAVAEEAAAEAAPEEAPAAVEETPAA